MSSQEKNIIAVDSLPSDVLHGATYSIEQANPNSFTHGFFKYPCKFIPEIPRWAIKKYLGDEGDVYDPFSGSGTTLLEGILSGHTSFGSEIDEIARLVTKVKTTPLNGEQLEELTTLAAGIVSSARRDNTPMVIPRIHNLSHWFNDENTRYLGKLKFLIEEVRDKDIRDFLNVCFVSIIKRTSNADDVSPKPYVSRKVIKTPPNALEEFAQTVKRYFNSIEEFSMLNTVKEAVLLEGDALDIRLDKQIDLAITSPPYINAFDYARTLRLENLWYGALDEQEIREKKKEYVGTESLKMDEEEKDLQILNESKLLSHYYNAILPKDRKRALIVKRFFADMRENLIQVKRVLRSGGHYVIVIGDSSIRNVEIESWRVLEDIALGLGFETQLTFRYVIKNPYIRIPRKKRGGKIKYDNVLVLKKVN